MRVLPVRGLLWRRGEQCAHDVLRVSGMRSGIGGWWGERPRADASSVCAAAASVADFDALGLATSSGGAAAAGVVHSEHGTQYTSFLDGTYANRSGIDR